MWATRGHDKLFITGNVYIIILIIIIIMIIIIGI